MSELDDSVQRLHRLEEMKGRLQSLQSQAEVKLGVTKELHDNAVAGLKDLGLTIEEAANYVEKVVDKVNIAMDKIELSIERSNSGVLN